MPPVLSADGSEISLPVLLRGNAGQTPEGLAENKGVRISALFGDPGDRLPRVLQHLDGELHPQTADQAAGRNLSVAPMKHAPDRLFAAAEFRGDGLQGDPLIEMAAEIIGDPISGLPRNGRGRSSRTLLPEHFPPLGEQQIHQGEHRLLRNTAFPAQTGADQTGNVAGVLPVRRKKMIFQRQH